MNKHNFIISVLFQENRKIEGNAFFFIYTKKNVTSKDYREIPQISKILSNSSGNFIFTWNQMRIKGLYSSY